MKSTTLWNGVNDLNEITWILCALIWISTCVVLAIILLKEKKQKTEEDICIEKIEKNNIEDDYVKPCFKELTQEQIDDIHAIGKITPAEKVKEWEDMDLCAPGDAIGSAAWRCRKFKNCHDCLVDYAKLDEYTSFYDTLKLCNLHSNKNDYYM